MGSEFERDGQRVYEEIASKHADVSASELWKMLEVRLCNETHRSALQDRFFSMKWNERRESVAYYAERLRSASMAWTTPISDDVLLNRFKAGLPQRLQDQAVLVTGNFDTVVSSVSRLSTAQQSAPRELVREVSEAHSPTGRQTLPAAKVPTYSSSMTNRFAHVKCHFCQQLGHIARFCSKNKPESPVKDTASLRRPNRRRGK